MKKLIRLFYRPDGGWTFFRASYRPVIPRMRIYRRFHRDTWKNRKLHGGTLYVLWFNFVLATWLAPSAEKTN